MNLLSSLAETAQPEGEVWFLYIRILQKWILSWEVASWQRKNVEKLIVSARDEKRHTHLRQATMQTPLCSASSWHCKKKKKKKTLEAAMKEVCMCWDGSARQFSFVKFLADCPKYTQALRRDCAQNRAGYVLCKRLVFDFFFFFLFFFKSLISPTPFPKIVPPFAYLQCDNGAVWNNTLSRVYRWAALIFSCDKTKSVNSWKRGGEIYNSYCLY